MAQNGMFDKETREYIANSNKSDYDIAQSLMYRLPDDKLWQAVSAYLIESVASIRRQHTLSIERNNTFQAWRSPTSEEIANNRAKRIREYDAWIADVTRIPHNVEPGQVREFLTHLGSERTKPWFAENGIPDTESSLYSSFRHWIRLRREALNLPRQLERQARRLWEMQVDFSATLKRAQFALGDGIKVTWGEATIEQHQQRIELLMANVIANAETARRHEIAVEMLLEHNATCLNELGAKTKVT